MAVFSDHEEAVLDAKYSLNEDVIATCGEDSNVFLYDSRTLQLEHALNSHEDEVSQVYTRSYTAASFHAAAKIAW